MKFEKSGLILFTQNYTECVAFYRDRIGLETIFAAETLTCLEFGGAYLMVESHGVAQSREKTRSENPCVIRFNVTDVPAAAAELRSRGIEVDVQAYDWGTIGVFLDPDGNRCELKDHWTP